MHALFLYISGRSRPFARNYLHLFNSWKAMSVGTLYPMKGLLSTATVVPCRWKHEKLVSNRLPRVKLSPEKITKLMFRRWSIVSEEGSDKCSKRQLRCKVGGKVKHEKLVSDELIMIKLPQKKITKLTFRSLVPRI